MVVADQSRHVEAFLEMMAVERGASKHTLAAYGRDLADVAAVLGKKGADLDEKKRAYEERYPEHRGKFRFIDIKELRT